MRHFVCVLVLMLGGVNAARAEPGHAHHQHHAMDFDRDGMSMNSNTDRLPRDCAEISDDIAIEVHVGTRYALRGHAFGYDRHAWQVPACARIHVTLVNDDAVRHQWMVHGLPRYLYPEGMFHLEANGGTRRSGTLIVPSDKATYLVHCDMSQHMEKGLKAQLVVGGGAGNLPSVPGISAARRPDRYR